LLSGSIAVQFPELQFPVITANQRAHWQIAQAHCLPPQPELQQWLLDPASLTAKLKQHCHEFAVYVIGQQPGTIRPDEARWLDAQDCAAIREVLLCCDGQPWVFARSVFPQQALDEPALQLGQIGRASCRERATISVDAVRVEESDRA